MVKKRMDFFNIPIFIISFNRKETIKKCIERFQNDGYNNLIVLDNASTNNDLLAYLRTLDCKVYFLKKNYGHHVLWECGLFNEIIDKQYFVLTDPDVLPINECPTDYIKQFYEILQKYPNKTKVGFALKLDDLPETYKFKYDIIRFESFYWENRLQYHFPIYDAPIDTTFALYAPGGGKDLNTFYEGIRTGYPYIARHLGWYVNNFSQEDYYTGMANNFSTSMDNAAMNDFRRSVISKLSMRQNESIYPMIKSIFSANYVKTHASWTSVLRCVGYLLLKKIAVSLKLRE
jgi:glycosyltransferase involved in cell wall biosynthesis